MLNNVVYVNFEGYQMTAALLGWFSFRILINFQSRFTI